ncbi:YhdP family protein [Roseobacteraceae bacterium NS-SX3]
MDIPAPAGGRRLRRRWRLLRAAVWAVAVLSLVAAAGVYAGLGTRLDAPEWLRQRVENRIERHLNGLQIEFGGITMVVNRGWRPRVGLRDVVLRQPDGTAVARLADAQASLAMRPLLRGRIQPKRITLSGLYATLRRGPGGLELTLSGGEAPLRQAASLPQLIEQWDSYFEQPVFSALTDAATDNLTLRYEDTRLNRVWTLDGGHLRLERDGQSLELSGGFSLLSGRGDVGAVEASYKSVIGDPSAEFGVLFSGIGSSDIAVQSAALGWLEVLKAPISGSLRGAVDTEGTLLPFSASLQISKGAIQPTAETEPVPIHGARSYFTYFPERQLLRFNELTVNTGWGAGTMEGEAHLAGIENGRLQELVAQLRFSDLQLNPRALYEEPLAFPGVAADFKLEMNPFRLTLGEMLIREGNTNVLLDGSFSAGPKGWEYALNGRADQITAERVKALWPAAAPPKPRQWVRENLHKGLARDISFALRGTGSAKPFLSLGLSFEDGEVQFQKHMPPVTGAEGQLSIYGSRLVVIATKGTVEADQGGRIDAAGTSFIIPDMTVKGGAPGIARVRARGPVTAALSLLNRPPLKIMEKASLPVDIARGQVALSGTLSLPLKAKIAPEEIEYHYTGEVTGAGSTVLVPGHELAAPRLTLSGDQDHVQLEGRGILSGVPATALWRQGVGKAAQKGSRVTGTVELSAAAVEAFNLGLPAGTVFGRGEGAYTVELAPGAPPRLELDSDLAGVGLRLAPVGWEMSEAATGKLALAAVLGAQPRVERLALSAPGLDAAGTVTIREGGGLAQARFSEVRLGGWLQGAVELTGRGSAPPAVAVSGGSLDLRRSPFAEAGAGGGNGAGTAAGPLTLRLDRLQVTEGIALSNFRGRFSFTGGFNGNFTGALNGQAAVRGVVVPQQGGIATRIQSQDAGGVFRAAGVLRHGAGGSFDMTLVPAGVAGEYDGSIEVRNTRIKNAPSMAALLNAVSLVGLFDELAGQGILFTEVEAKFRLGADYLRLRESSAIGPSIGLSMDGVYDLNNSRLNMRGVISPIYILNAIGSLLTRKGEGLIGFAFTLRGTADDPQVQVNPLSGLAPGMFREIFRGPAPTVPGEEPPPRPEPVAPQVQGGDR